MHLERISFFVSFAILQILIDLVNIEATKSVTITVEDRSIYETTAQFDTFGVERFDELVYRSDPSYDIQWNPTWRTTFGNSLLRKSPITGTYIDLEVARADIYGGATSKGVYIFARRESYYGLRLDNPANFFGVWVSSADDANVVRFFHHDHKVFEYYVKDVLEGLGENRRVFLGNPTYIHWHGGYGNSGQEYLFINAFFNGGLVYDYVQFAQEGRGCFESDNHSVGNWTQTSGTHVMTEPAIPVRPVTRKYKGSDSDPFVVI